MLMAKPCPGCGKAPEFLTHPYLKLGNGHTHQACLRCDCKTDRYDALVYCAWTRHPSNMEKAIDNVVFRWNNQMYGLVHL